MSYSVGDLIRITGTFTSAAGSATDPGTVIAKYRDPAGTVTTLIYLTDAALQKESTGVYYVDIDANQVGHWLYRFDSTGSGQAASPTREFIVFTSEFP